MRPPPSSFPASPSLSFPTLLRKTESVRRTVLSRKAKPRKHQDPGWGFGVRKAILRKTEPVRWTVLLRKAMNLIEIEDAPSSDD